MARIAKKEVIEKGAWKITILYDEEGNVVGAILESSRSVNPIYIAKNENVTIKLPATVRRVLKKYGFRVVE